VPPQGCSCPYRRHGEHLQPDFGFHPLLLERDANELAPCPDAGLVEQLLHDPFDRVLGHIEFERDFLVAESFEDGAQHVAFPGSPPLPRRRVVFDIRSGNWISSWKPRIQESRSPYIVDHPYHCALSTSGEFLAESGDGGLELYRLAP
jgi:hypothetical protein